MYRHIVIAIVESYSLTIMAVGVVVSTHRRSARRTYILHISLCILIIIIIYRRCLYICISELYIIVLYYRTALDSDRSH